MIRSRSIIRLAIAAIAALSVVSVAAAGGTVTKGQTKPTLQVRSTSLGKTLVDSRGRTLYLFKKDKGTKSACSGECAKNWPPLSTDHKPTAGRGLSASKVGTTKRSDGKRQVTYRGHPLYRFVRDKKPGDTKGQDLKAFGAAWYALSPAGNQISDEQSGGGSDTSNPGTGGGY